VVRKQHARLGPEFNPLYGCMAEKSCDLQPHGFTAGPLPD
jgi:hypothetical protein